jgi:hypothetical protein
MDRCTYGRIMSDFSERAHSNHFTATSLYSYMPHTKSKCIVAKKDTQCSYFMIITYETCYQNIWNACKRDYVVQETFLLEASYNRLPKRTGSSTRTGHLLGGLSLSHRRFGDRLRKTFSIKAWGLFSWANFFIFYFKLLWSTGRGDTLSSAM